jgi:predicted aconitase with swiveling domain
MFKKFAAVAIVFACCAFWLAGNLDVTIHEYDVPTPKSKPHDPAVAPDGALWYTGQMANRLGRLDPKTGTIKEFPLKTPDSGPHGLMADKDGNIWFTANFKAYIGKLDPRTGDITEFHMPDPKAEDPHSLTFDHEGNIFFTTEESNFVGKLDPKSGKVTVKEVPTSHANLMELSPGRTASFISASSEPTKSGKSIQAHLRSPKSNFRMEPGLAGLRTIRMVLFTTATSSAGTLAGSICEQRRSRSGRRPAAGIRSLMGLLQRRTESCGTASLA